MRKVSSFLFILLCSAAFIFAQTSVAQGQEDPFLPFPADTPTPSPTTDPNLATPVTPQPILSPSPGSSPVVIGSTPSDEIQFSNFQKKYFELLESYRTQEQVFSVAKAQYAQLNTLASQELAVQETRKLIDIRADIFIVYLDMLEYILNQTKGIPIENKSPQLVQLRLLKESVLLHKNINNSSLDRLTLDQESLNFKNRIADIEKEAYYTLSLIRLGRVQHSLDKLVAMQGEVKKVVDEKNLTSTQKAEKERGFNEIQRTIDQTTATITLIKEEVFMKRKVRSLGEFSSLSSELIPVFSGINQTVEFLQEIRK